MTDPQIIPITLTVAHVEFGGNTGRGAYFYSFSPDLLIVGKGEQDVTLRYAFCKSVPHRFKIISLLNSDSTGQIGPQHIDPDGRGVQVVNANKDRTLIFFSVVVKDTHTGNHFSCDPQVGNDPEISPTEFGRH
ncbi:hypothetical protein ABQW55_000600 [Xanthomonas citri pv. malvacearum]|uniref:Uncharacterized protein n=1 Tax=Xanthomonas campestris pv. malvacearum TaxID=86040 RepID=A0AA45BU29_XANCM|nr:hypothetical protein [Xanthomonas citri]AOL17999.1 hypothetical protein BGK55_00710 [Xanthomonas citri pv. malvacearum]ASM99375.1 hypothetical protein APY29_00540 [Xanthomonas citri pv. malvacearum]ASN07597.1 hypothetical protein APY30_00555 [Xanthomonas citri pv. malvacearum]ASY82783.1 hypothetical protein CIW71_00600 [Xanthomonas citri pv. malvacearum]ASY87168.1 hypothetical protein CIW72_00740 [Xanthomonas citri pv. malvacearum]